MDSPFTPFALVTPRLILLPTPLAVSLPPYRALYASLHADPIFCQIAFGSHFPPRNWSDAETEEVIRTRDIARCWQPRGLGDFAIGLRPPPGSGSGSGSNDVTFTDSSDGSLPFQILQGDELTNLIGSNMADRLDADGVIWAGYAGLRDATTTSLPPREVDDPVLPGWREMVELRYGLSSQFWGQGVGKEAASAIMQWAVKERGVTRFIAETERENRQSARLLQKLGFVASGTDYWKEPSEIEWELVV